MVLSMQVQRRAVLKIVPPKEEDKKQEINQVYWWLCKTCVGRARRHLYKTKV